MFSIEREAIRRVTERLREVLGENIVAVVAFGSRVRGDFDGESDFDVLILVRKRDFEVIENQTSYFFTPSPQAQDRVYGL